MENHKPSIVIKILSALEFVFMDRVLNVIDLFYLSWYFNYFKLELQFLKKRVP